MSRIEKMTELSLNFEVLNQLNAPTFLQMVEITSFLHEHLGEFRDSKDAIQSSLEYAFNKSAGTGGFAILARMKGKLIGACVVNTTAMQNYIPPNTLVYIATHKDFRGNGITKSIISQTLRLCKGGLALHVQPDNPARKLYENIGFKYKYLEMRFEH